MPLTLAALASVLQMHGAGATITSDNKGIEDLLVPIRGQLQESRSAGPPATPTAKLQHYKQYYSSTYTRGTYSRFYGKLSLTPGNAD
jgi:hypothetical protein